MRFHLQYRSPDGAALAGGRHYADNAIDEHYMPRFDWDSHAVSLGYHRSSAFLDDLDFKVGYSARFGRICQLSRPNDHALRQLEGAASARIPHLVHWYRVSGPRRYRHFRSDSQTRTSDRDRNPSRGLTRPSYLQAARSKERRERR